LVAVGLLCQPVDTIFFPFFTKRRRADPCMMFYKVILYPTVNFI